MDGTFIIAIPGNSSWQISHDILAPLYRWGEPPPYKFGSASSVCSPAKRRAGGFLFKIISLLRAILVQ
jgi:hypothetical protein